MKKKEQDNPIFLRCTSQMDSQRNMFWSNRKVNKKPFLLSILSYFLVEEEKEEIRNILISLLYNEACEKQSRRLRRIENKISM